MTGGFDGFDATQVRAGPGERVRLGISACLTGRPVRFDGSHKRDRFLTESLDAYVDWVSVCPEVGAGMGVPRPTLRLLGHAGGPHLVVGATGEDVTAAVEEFSQRALDRIAGLDLCGFVLKSRSPTCGMERVRVYDGGGMPHKDGIGIFAAALMERFPELPVEEEGRLQDATLREGFLDAVFAYARWRALARQPFEARTLVEFHQRNKFLLRVHSPADAAELGRLVAGAGGPRDGEDLCRQYGALFMHAVKTRTSPGKHAAMLRRIAGHLRPHLGAGARALLHESIDDYEHGLSSRHAPITLLRHHAEERGLSYLSQQSYLDPYPKALGRH